MRKEFEAKLMQERIIDTKQYRYIVTEEHDAEKQWAEIKRLPISDLDTTKAIDGWETIKRIY
jgi:hypothetical protein